MFGNNVASKQHQPSTGIRSIRRNEKTIFPLNARFPSKRKRPREINVDFFHLLSPFDSGGGERKSERAPHHHHHLSLKRMSRRGVRRKQKHLIHLHQNNYEAKIRVKQFSILCFEFFIFFPPSSALLEYFSKKIKSTHRHNVGRKEHKI